MGLFDIFKKKKINEGAITEYVWVKKDLKEKENVTDSKVQMVNMEEITGASFLMRIEDVFYITGRGMVVTGRIDLGSISVGEWVNLINSTTREKRKVRVKGIEMFRKIITTASVGDIVGILLEDVNKNEVKRDDILYKI